MNIIIMSWLIETEWGKYVSEQYTIGLWPFRQQAINWTDAQFSSVGSYELKYQYKSVIWKKT